MIADFLTGLDGWDIAAIICGSWIILAAVVAIPIGRSMARADRAEWGTQPATYPPPVPPSVKWLPFLPPVPETDAAWLSVWPVDTASKDEIRLRLEQIAAAEGWTPIDEEWAA